jgi:hypothetical protein
MRAVQQVFMQPLRAAQQLFSHWEKWTNYSASERSATSIQAANGGRSTTIQPLQRNYSATERRKPIIRPMRAVQQVCMQPMRAAQQLCSHWEKRTSYSATERSEPIIQPMRAVQQVFMQPMRAAQQLCSHWVQRNNYSATERGVPIIRTVKAVQPVFMQPIRWGYSATETAHHLFGQ